MTTIKTKDYRNLKQKTIGLIGKKHPDSIYFETRFGIHTFGLQFPVDILILDKNNKVIKQKENLQKNSIFFWNPKHKKVLELPPGSISKRKIEIGKEIKVVFID